MPVDKYPAEWYRTNCSSLWFDQQARKGRATVTPPEKHRLFNVSMFNVSMMLGQAKPGEMTAGIMIVRFDVNHMKLLLHPLSSRRFWGDQYSFSGLWASNHTSPSASKSSITVCARAFSHLRFNRSIETLTNPST